MNTNIHTKTVLSSAWRLAQYSFQLAPLFILAFVQMLPAQSLSFTKQHADPFRVLVFPSAANVIVDSAPSSRVFESGTVLGVVASAYNSVPEQTDVSPFITASGTRTRDGVLATNFLPLGTKLVINNAEYIVEDRMNSRYNDTYKVDIWMESISNARRFGTQPMLVEIVSVPER